MEFWAVTDPGKVRKENQDCYRVHTLGANALVAVVCDGMGGARSGKVASTLAADAFLNEMQHSVREDSSVKKIENAMRNAVSAANAAVFANAGQCEENAGMGTTLVAAAVFDGTAVLANVGDSRAYLVNENEARCVTMDHSLVEMMVSSGKITREQAKSFPGKNYITRAVGTEPDVKCDIYRIPVQQGDNILLCSDGLSNFLADREIQFETVYGADKSDCCGRLVEIVKHRGAPDNVTALLIAI